MPDAERGRVRAAGDHAAASDRVALARDPGTVDRERDQLFRRPGRAHRAHGIGPDEARVLDTAPAQPRFDRAALGGELIAVEVVARLQAQRVARGQAGRDGAAARELIPQRGGVGR